MTKVTQAHVEARASSIREAANRMFARKGFDGATMQEIATEADLSAGALYRYFPTKQHLLRAVFEDCMAQNRALFEQATDSAASPLGALLQIGDTIRQMFKTGEMREQTILGMEASIAAARYPSDLLE